MREIIGIVLNAVRTLRKLAWMGCLVAVACQAQTNVQTSVPMVTPAAGVPVVQPDVMLTPEMARRIEVMIRNKAQVSPDSLITIGVPSAVSYTHLDVYKRQTITAAWATIWCVLAIAACRTVDIHRLAAHIPTRAEKM